ncbi:MAG: TetR/AcrR family transcriptional regulator [Deltaproteobacteria bacterium]|nr:TetR/AcrR family transcriptional regulator [Deltaproteobacteria bacterium]
MARPPQADSERTINAILDATEQLCGEKNIDAIKISDIARDAGVAPSTVYHYFCNREGLWDACLDRLRRDAEQTNAGLLPKVQAAMFDPTSLGRCARDIYRFVRSRRGAVRMRLRDALSRGDFDLEDYGEFFVPFLKQVIEDDVLRLRAAVALRGLMLWILRYGSAADRDLVALAGNSEVRSVEEIHQIIEDFIADSAERLLSTTLQRA